jgi:hypothetical protein
MFALLSPGENFCWLGALQKVMRECGGELWDNAEFAV